MAESSRPRVILTGPPASGKTKIGRIVAKSIGEPFLDTDTVLVGRYGSIADIFADKGEPWFRGREAEVVAESLTAPGVISLGGGAVTSSATRQALVGHTVVGLDISQEAVESRLANNKRPLLVDGLESWKRLVSARKAWYEEVASIVIDVSHRQVTEVADEIVQRLGQISG